MDPIHKVVLSLDELAYLKNGNFLPAHLLEVLDAAEAIRDNARALHVSSLVAEEFGSVLTDYLAKVGFAEDYEPTNEGRLLENLIDRFRLG